LLSKFIVSLVFIALLVTTREAGAPQQSNANSNSVGKPTHTAKTAPKLQPNPIFDEVLSDLKQKTRVPLRLPAYWPFSERTPEDQLKKDQGEENLYATIVDVSARHYSIQMAFGRGCEGQHVCRDGGLTGSSEFHDDYPDRPKVSVQLRESIPGKFVDAQCGAYCDESVLYWSENGYHYSVSSKAAKKDELMKIANSAIEVAHAESGLRHRASSQAGISTLSKQEKANP
jgi:hypothetical protein